MSAPVRVLRFRTAGGDAAASPGGHRLIDVHLNDSQLRGSGSSNTVIGPHEHFPHRHRIHGRGSKVVQGIGAWSTNQL
jgi:hypothetical protein